MKNTSRYLFFVALITLTLSSCSQTNTNEHATKTNLNTTENEWKKKLTDAQYYVLREKGTEAPFSGELLLNKEKGVYKCAGCGNELFTDEMKFDSHCGWPSFDKEIEGGKIIKTVDNSHGMSRTEITCAKCGGHLGHLFDDGPTATGQRYCVNSLSLEFTPVNKKVVENNTDTITLGGGCFWCVEAVYEELKGVKTVESGYSGGNVKNPTYSEVCTGSTNHAEVTQIVFDKSQTSIYEIFKVFFSSHDPTTLNRQGADAGTQYRSVIFYRNDEQKKIAQDLVSDLNKTVYDGKITTQIIPFKAFYKAEDYHQDYFKNNKDEPYCKMVIQPKIEKFEKIFHDKLKN
ncbi:MAG: bifunctional methionine sulfoxide reductase B/A protein [Chitinophagaceae bacterium]|jgi:peptide methionine sulfoxide reductase msrA/msrB|nr:bifunctional methionine sulfoxide reductase B/A protein [Chitinophagaceae bacterium]